MLGAGGVLGAAWSIGALKAFQATTGLDARDAAVIVGTSAGSVLAASLGCGLGVDVLVNHHAGLPADDDPRLDYDYDRGHGGPLPPRPRCRPGSAGLLLTVARHPRRASALTVLSSVLPEGRGSLAAVGALVETFSPPGPIGWATHPRTWIVAMDYRTGRRVVFGQEGAPSTRLSKAVVASCAIPGWYQPVEVGAHRYVDGGTISSTSLDLLTETGVQTVYVISPMTSVHYDHPATFGGRLERRLRRMFTRRLDAEVAQMRATGADVVVLCPGLDDLAAIGTNLMDATRRERVFETAVSTVEATLRRGTYTAVS